MVPLEGGEVCGLVVLVLGVLMEEGGKVLVLVEGEVKVCPERVCEGGEGGGGGRRGVLLENGGEESTGGEDGGGWLWEDGGGGWLDGVVEGMLL